MLKACLLNAKKMIWIPILLCSTTMYADEFIPDNGKKMVLSGVVSKLISTPKDVEPSFKAHFLELGAPITFNDDDGCGEITQDKIALNQFDMGKYQGKKVRVTGTVFCQQQITGRYHLQNFKIDVM